MSEIKLFDTWTFQEEVPEPFHQLLKKEGLRKTTTTEYSNAIVHAFQKFKAPFSGKIVHIFPEQSAVI